MKKNDIEFAIATLEEKIDQINYRMDNDHLLPKHIEEMQDEKLTIESSIMELKNLAKTEKRKAFLEDTRDILVGYDGCKTEEQLKGLIDETKARLTAYLDNKIEEYEDSL